MIHFKHSFKVLSTPGFDGWLDCLGDLIGAAHIKVRLARVRDGHWGDCVSLGEGLFELRIHRGPGYRHKNTERISYESLADERVGRSCPFADAG